MRKFLKVFLMVVLVVCWFAAIIFQLKQWWLIYSEPTVAASTWDFISMVILLGMLAPFLNEKEEKSVDITNNVGLTRVR